MKIIGCVHVFRRISNNWFHWNTGDVMTIGRCDICGFEKEIDFEKIKRIDK